MAGLVLAVLLPWMRSVALSVKLPVVLNQTSKLVVPEARPTAPGNVAVVSLELRPTLSLTVLTRFQNRSAALTVTEKLEPTLWALGVPVFPETVPGAALSPAT